ASAAFFPGQYNTAGGNASQPHTSANAGLEVHTNRIRVMESLTTDRLEDTSYGFFNPQAFQNFLTTPATTLSPRQIVRYKQAQTDVIFDVTSKLTLRGGHRYLRGDAIVTAGNLSQVGPSIAGELHRNVGIAGLSYRPWSKLSINADYEGSSSDR